MIVGVNMDIPGCEYVDYFDDQSLRDYDIAIINPDIPYMDRIYFDGGGSCLAIAATEKLSKAMKHWRNEIEGALASGKTIFFVARSPKQDSAATGSEMKRANHRTYSTTSVSSYHILPVSLAERSSKGSKLKVKGALFQGLLSVLGDRAEYRAIFGVKFAEKAGGIFARDNAAVGGVIRLKGQPGALVILPDFDFDEDDIVEGADGKRVWSEEASKLGAAVRGQLVAIDKHLRSKTSGSPPPEWISTVTLPQTTLQLDSEIEDLIRMKSELEEKIIEKNEARAESVALQALLYENGKSLENAIERVITMMGFSVEGYRSEDLEIDHVILSPDGRRYVGEAEGKDNSAIDIKKFRQLESNINEDFERDEIEEPARGILFGNGFRLTPPRDREEQFTRKSLTNAKRLGSILVRTSDLYPIAVYLTDHPDDEEFKAACREALSASVGEIVQFPTLP